MATSPFKTPAFAALRRAPQDEVGRKLRSLKRADLLHRIMIRPAIIAAIMLSITPASVQAKDQPRPDTFVDVTAVAPGILVEARYATAHNFVGQKIDG